MKTPGIRAILVSTSLLAFSDPGSFAYGNHGRNRAAVYAPAETVLPVATSYVVPTSFALSPTSYVLPTSYALPTSYVVPTSYVYPTSYVATSSVLPSVYATVYESSSYVPTSYLIPTYSYRTRRILSPRRFATRPIYATTTSYYVPTTATYYPTTYTPTSYVYPTTYTPTSYVYPTIYTPTTYVYPTTYTPTTYVYPTIYDAPVVAMADPCCTGSAPSAPSAPAVRSTPAQAPPAGTSDRTTSSAVEGTTSQPEPRNETPPAPAPAPAPAESKPELPPAPGSDLPPPTNPPARTERSTGPGPEPLPATTGAELPPPVAPADTGTPAVAQPPVAPGGTPPEPYKVKRPVYPVDSNVTIPPGKAPQSAGASRTGAPGQYQVNRPAINTDNVRSTRNILRGKVRSGDSGNLEGGVQVILSSRTNAFTDRVVTTDATGHYAVRLPDGDWTVNVVMPSGRAYAVSQLTISGGEIVDDLGRDVPSLTITR